MNTYDFEPTGFKKDETLDIDTLFKNAKHNSENNATSMEVGKTPLQLMREKQSSGLVITNNDDDGAKIGGTMNEDRFADVMNTMNDIDTLAEKAQMVGITRKPTSDIEMAELINQLDSLDINDLKRMSDAVASNANTIIKTEDVMGTDITMDTFIADETGALDNNGMFIPKSSVKHYRETHKEENSIEELTELPADTVSVVIEKEPVKEGETSILNFTEEEHDKLKETTQIELVKVNKIQINSGSLRRPDENFIKNFKTHSYRANSTSAVMTFVASRFRVKMRSLVFGEYIDLSLSTDITDVEVLNKKLTIFYNTIEHSSVGIFTSYEDFLRNFAYKDVSLGTYCLYMATNPEVLEINLSCGVDTCKKKFNIGFKPRNLMAINRLSERFLEIMETAGKLDGLEAIKYHNESSIITKQIIEMADSGVALEIGLRSCYDMIHIVLPFINNIENIMIEKHPDDINKVHEIITYVTNYVSAIYFKDEHGEYTLREDNIETLVELLYMLSISDYEILSAIMTQTDEDYAYRFGLQHVVCPGCGNVTEFIPINIDEEVFRQFQELGNTRIDKKSLPRL